MKKKEKRKSNGEWLKSVKPTFESFHQNYLESVPIVNGIPQFSGTSESFHALAQFWIGKIIIFGEEYYVRFHYRRWMVVDGDKRNLPDNVHLEILRLYNIYLGELAKEKELRASHAKERESIYNARYYQAAKQKIHAQRKEQKRFMKIQHEIQLKEVYQMIVEGKTKIEIKDFLFNKYSYGERRVNQLLDISAKQLREEVTYDKDTLRDKHHAMLIELYKKNLEMMNFKECRLVLETIQKVYGLNIVEPTNHKVEQVVTFKFNSPDIKKLPNGELEADDVEYIEQPLLNEADQLDSIKEEEQKIAVLKSKREGEGMNGHEANQD